MVDTTDSKSVIRKGVGVQVPPGPPNSSFKSDDYNPIEWAKIMVEAKTIMGKPTSLAREYNTITNEEGISK